MSEIVFLNGIFCNREEAKISPDDRGFIFADGIYEVVKYYNGNPFRYKDHIERLDRSLSEIGIKQVDTSQFFEIFNQLLKKNSLGNSHAGIYLQISRGPHKRIHHFPDEVKPTIYAFAFPLPSFTQNLENGIRVITHEDIRWQRCDIKSVSLLPNTMIYNKAVKSGAGEAILIRNGQVTEATHSSVFGVKNGALVTHPLTNHILPGITRKVVLEICAEMKILVIEKAISETDLFQLDELMITGTGSEITPVVQINDYILRNGKPGELTNQLKKRFFELV
jgi:D-alanine transaminase